ncbi:hypothetical protein OJF2_16900 [Aquisphaera giovannonii]|uniref:Uncharacterized protein n=1 Tax=Aquisphaera giovannonii TaxID=406548 RepID=A0A5B9VXX8_9BACT|nr:hypothetical protein OJF2_16900 [Aquisphaera giovannonii]
MEFRSGASAGIRDQLHILPGKRREVGEGARRRGTRSLLRSTRDQTPPCAP